jgi:hypothetical protein
MLDVTKFIVNHLIVVVMNENMPASNLMHVDGLIVVGNFPDPMN